MAPDIGQMRSHDQALVIAREVVEAESGLVQSLLPPDLHGEFVDFLARAYESDQEHFVTFLEQGIGAQILAFG